MAWNVNQEKDLLEKVKMGMRSMVLVGVGIVILLIMSIVVNTVLSQNYANSTGGADTTHTAYITGLNATITGFFVTLMLIGGLILAGMTFMKGRK